MRTQKWWTRTWTVLCCLKDSFLCHCISFWSGKCTTFHRVDWTKEAFGILFCDLLQQGDREPSHSLRLLVPFTDPPPFPFSCSFRCKHWGCLAYQWREGLVCGTNIPAWPLAPLPASFLLASMPWDWGWFHGLFNKTVQSTLGLTQA